MEPIEIHVRLSPDDEVLALRARVAELEAQAEAARAERDRLEYKYRCEISPWLAPGAELAPLTRGMLFRGGPLLRGRAGWLFMPCGHTKKGRNTPPLFWVQYLN